VCVVRRRARRRCEAVARALSVEKRSDLAVHRSNSVHEVSVHYRREPARRTLSRRLRLRSARLFWRRLGGKQDALHGTPHASGCEPPNRLRQRLRRWRAPSLGTRQSSSWAAGELAARANLSGVPHEVKDANIKLELGGLLHKKWMRNPSAVDIDEVDEIQRADLAELGQREMLRACCAAE
jgi:hypothetical protein